MDQQAGTGVATKEVIDIAISTDAPVLAGEEQVETGSTINAIYLNIQATGEGAAGVLNNIYMIIYKNPGNNILAAQIPNGNVTGGSDFKRQIFHTEMRMLGASSQSIPVSIFNGVIRIPKTYKNMRVNDKISIQLFTPGGTANYCLQCIYKEYR